MTLALAAVSGVLYGLAFPPWRLWPLAWIALVPLLVGIARAPTRSVLLAGWVWTMALSLTAIPWFGAGVASYFGQSVLFGVALFVLVPTVTGAVDYMAFSWCYRALDRLGPVERSLVAGAAWVVAELGRTKLFFGNPWELLPYSQLDGGPLVQIADSTGIYGVSFVVVVVNAAAAEVVTAWLGRRPRSSRVWGSLGLAIGLAVAAGTWGRARLVTCDVARAGEGRSIAAVQANLDIGMQWRPELYGENLGAYLRLTGDAIRVGAPAVVFWPENAMTFFLEEGGMYRDLIAAVLGRAGTELVAGGPKRIGSARDAYYNSAYMVRPDGGIAGRYDKQLLIPFAERFPMLRSEALLRRFARIREFAPGAPSPPLRTAAGTVGILICNEALFPEPARAHVRAGAQYLAVLANDAWTESAQYGETAVEYARMRAIEQRRWLVRSSTSGPSVVVDPCGVVVSRTGASERAVLTGRLVPRDELTSYARFGDWMPAGCVVLVAYALCAVWRRRRSSVPIPTRRT